MPTSPTSPAPTDLAALRTELNAINALLLDLFGKRRAHVALIQAAKVRDGRAQLDPVRERALFQELAPLLVTLAERDVLSFSLLMESHAGEAYPRWSEGAHLSELPQKCFQRVNPLLVKQLWPEKFATLRFHADYAFLQDS
jgi:chorismate mutase